MEAIVETRREKKIFKLDADEFLSGKWLEQFQLMDPKPEKLDITYKNGFLTVKYMYKQGGVEDDQ